MNANARDIGNAMRAVEFAITDAGYEHTTPIEDVIRDQKRRINELASGISNLAVPANFSKTLAQALRAQATKGDGRVRSGSTAGPVRRNGARCYSIARRARRVQSYSDSSSSRSSRVGCEFSG